MIFFPSSVTSGFASSSDGFFDAASANSSTTAGSRISAFFFLGFSSISETTTGLGRGTALGLGSTFEGSVGLAPREREEPTGFLPVMADLAGAFFLAGNLAGMKY